MNDRTGFAAVGIDTRSLRHGPAGVATYVRNLLTCLPWLEGLTSASAGNNLLWNCLRVPLAQLRRRWCLYHAPSYTSPVFSFCPVILNIHDLAYLAQPQWYPYKLDRVRSTYYRTCLLRAARIVTCSEFSRGEITRLFPAVRDRIRVVPMGVSSFFEPDEGLARIVVEKYRLPPRFILHVGDLHARRNLLLLGSVAKRLEIPLVLVGRPLERDSFPSGALLLTDVPLPDLKGIYNAASVFAYPSLYEGFGLPLLEAMACGLPVVAARRASLPEVCGEAALLVEPTEEALVRGISAALDDRTRLSDQGRGRARQFSWRQTARLTLDVYRELHHDLPGLAECGEDR